MTVIRKNDPCDRRIEAFFRMVLLFVVQLNAVYNVKNVQSMFIIVWKESTLSEDFIHLVVWYCTVIMLHERCECRLLKSRVSW